MLNLTLNWGMILINIDAFFLNDRKTSSIIFATIFETFLR